MNTKKENIIILILFMFSIGLLATINIYPQSEDVKITTLNPLLHLQKQKDQSSNEPAPPPGSDKNPTVVREINLGTDWGRDPFKFQKTEKNQAENILSTHINLKQKDKQLVLSLILLSDTTRTATINNGIFCEGDVVGREKIVSIQPDGVVLKNNGEVRFLALQKKPLLVRRDND